MKNIDLLKNNNIDIDSSLELLGDIETYNEILEEFLNNIEERLTKIDNYKKSNDMENYSVEVHAMKSDSKYLGFTKLAELSLEHQNKSEEKNIDYINNNYDELITEAKRIIKIAKEYLGS